MLIFLIDSNVNDGKQVSDHLASGSGEYVRVPDTNDLIVAARCDDVGVGAESDTVDPFWYPQGLTRAVNVDKNEKRSSIRCNNCIRNEECYFDLTFHTDVEQALYPLGFQSTAGKYMLGRILSSRPPTKADMLTARPPSVPRKI